MKVSSKTLRMTAACVLAVSLLAYLAAATAGLVVRHNLHAASLALTVMAWCVITWLASGMLFAVAWLVQWREDHPRPCIRVRRQDKPPGWNRDVLHWFHAGPERRVKTEEYRAAFHERAARGALCVICGADTGSDDEYCPKHHRLPADAVDDRGMPL